MAIETKPVEDTVQKINNELAVGEDLEFQRKWWKVERGIWIFFLLLIIADLLGAFGRGWLAKAHRAASDNSLAAKCSAAWRMTEAARACAYCT